MGVSGIRVEAKGVAHFSDVAGGKYRFGMATQSLFTAEVGEGGREYLCYSVL